MSEAGAPSKDRVYRAILESASIREAAAKVALSKSTVGKHVSDLLAFGAIVKKKSGLGFERGPLAYVYEQGMKAVRTDTRVGSGSRRPEAVLRVHRGGWAWPVRWGPAAEVPWESAWDPNRSGKMTDFALRAEDGTRFWLKLEGGAPGVLMVQLADQLVYDPAEAAGAREKRMAAAKAAALAFAERYGVQLYLQRGYEFQPAEFAVEMEGLVKFGVPGESYWWVDGSPGDGRLEAESQHAPAGAVLLQFPTWTRELKESQSALAGRVVELERATVDLIHTVGRVVGVQHALVRPMPVEKPRELRPDQDPAVS